MTRRLWVVTECYPRPRAPAHCAFAHRQLVGVHRAGWDVRVLVPNGWFPPFVWRVARAWRQSAREHVPNGWLIDGIAVADLRYQNRVPSRLSRPRDFGARVAAALERLLRGAGAARGRDVLMVKFALPHGPAVREVAQTLGLPYVVQLRGDDVWVWPHASERSRIGFTATVRDADLLVSVSDALIREAERISAGDLPPAVVVPNGIDLARFRPPVNDAERAAARAELGVAPDEVAVLCVGDALARKGWRELLDALGTLRADGVPVVLLAALSSCLRDLDIAAEAARRAPGLRVRMLHQLSGDALGRLYRAADIFCLASYWEGLSNALLEAMASGLPVVTTAVAGHPEVVTDGADGRLVPPREAAPLARAIDELLADAPMRARLGEAARARAVAVGDSARAGERMAALLEGVCRGVPATELRLPSPYALSAAATARSA
ncbi:MAG: glycosyltransferase [Gemmatimonadota bacterium]|nr:glycosyltransferase [Gemmatimonadota bacterium]